MKNKEDIFDKCDFSAGYEPIEKSMVYAAMDEYAKEVAIDFRKWCDENEYACSAGLGRNLTNDELYNYHHNNIFPEK